MASLIARGLGGSVAALAILAACSDLGGLSDGEEPADASTDRKAATPDANEDDAGITCEEGKTACGSLCSNTTNDAQNCGRCGHDCLGAKCTASACEPITMA